jgi:hypothetical protein
LVKQKIKKKFNQLKYIYYLETIDLSTFGLNIDKKQTFVYHRDLIPALNEVEQEYELIFI